MWAATVVGFSTAAFQYRWMIHLSEFKVCSVYD
jgi:hypothetical protein